MAYFAQNKYDLALDDFEASVNYQADNFKSLYYIGIVYSVQGENEKAIEYFDRSLQINEYQSHLYYRRALAKYNLSLYAEAIEDLANANKLGLDDNDCKRLHAQLMRKLHIHFKFSH